MCRVKVFCVVALLSFSGVFSKPSLTANNHDYSNHKVLRVSSDDEQALSRSIRGISQDFDIDIWSRNARSADIMVGPVHLDDVQRTVTSSGLTSELLIDNVQKLLDDDYLDRRRTKRAAEPDITNTYLRYSEINNFLTRVSSTATSADVTLGSLGQSFQGRDTKYVKIQEKNANRREKYTIVIDAGIHAREWIAPSVALNVINKLAFNPENDPEVKEMLAMFDWVIAPTINPDGYEFSHSSSTNRLWRKTRTTVHSSLSWCAGVDVNRNFGFDWNPSIGGSTNPCSDLFAGPKPFSEPESQNVRDWLTGLKAKAKLYLTMHAYGQFMLYPYGSNASRFREEESLMISVANAFANQLNNRGRKYQVGNSAAMLYAAAGGSDDYAKGALGITLSYTPELSPASSSPGFILPPTDIAPVVNDHWSGIKAMVRKVFEKYGYPQSSSTTTTTVAAAGNRDSNNNPSSSNTVVTNTNTGSGGVNTDTGYILFGGIVPVTINGVTYYLDSSVPAVQQWLTSYYYYKKISG